MRVLGLGLLHVQQNPSLFIPASPPFLHFQLLTVDRPVFPVRDQFVSVVGFGGLGISVTMFQ